MAISYFYVVFVKIVVIDTIDFKVMRPEACCGEKCHEKEE